MLSFEQPCRDGYKSLCDNAKKAVVSLVRVDGCRGSGRGLGLRLWVGSIKDNGGKCGEEIHSWVLKKWCGETSDCVSESDDVRVPFVRRYRTPFRRASGSDKHNISLIVSKWHWKVDRARCARAYG